VFGVIIVATAIISRVIDQRRMMLGAERS